MRYVLNNSMKKEEFPDGDLLVYDTLSETFHILNKTAAEILRLLENDNYEVAKAKYFNTNKDVDTIDLKIKEDFDNVLNVLLKNNIISEK